MVNINARLVRCSYPVDLLNKLGPRIPGSAKLQDLLVISADLGRERFDLIEEREQCSLQGCGDVVPHLPWKILRRAGREATSECLNHAPYRVNELRANTNQTIPGLQQCQIGLRLCTAMSDRVQQSDIHPRQTRKRACINAVVLIVIAVDQPDSPRIRHDDFVSEFAQQSADPRRVGSDLNYNPTTDRTRKLRGKPRRSCTEFALLDNFPFRPKDAIVTVSIADVDANDLASLPAAAFDQLRLFTSFCSAGSLFQGWSPFCAVERINWIEAINKPSITAARLLIPSLLADLSKRILQEICVGDGTAMKSQADR